MPRSCARGTTATRNSRARSGAKAGANGAPGPLISSPAGEVENRRSDFKALGAKIPKSVTPKRISLPFPVVHSHREARQERTAEAVTPRTNSSKPNQGKPRKTKKIGLGFSWIHSADSGLFNGLRAIRPKKFRRERRDDALRRPHRPVERGMRVHRSCIGSPARQSRLIETTMPKGPAFCKKNVLGLFGNRPRLRPSPPPRLRRATRDRSRRFRAPRPAS